MQYEKQLTIQILGWNSRADLEQSLPALQRAKDAVTVRYIDNNSNDTSIATVKRIIPEAEIISLPENAGYASGNNIGLSYCQTPFVLILNPDVSVEWQGIEELLKVMEANPKLGAVQGLLLRQANSNTLDSAGIVRTVTLNGIDRGSGKKLTDAFKESRFVDAVTGACCLLRIQALQNIAHGTYSVAKHNATEIFDKDFFAYKEDVDLGWRLEHAGWKILFEPVLVGHHRRTLKVEGVGGWGTRLSQILIRLRSNRTRMSLRNYMWLITKNASVKQLLLHGVFIDARLLFFLALSLVYWPLFSVWGEAWQGLPNMLAKRRKNGLR